MGGLLTLSSICLDGLLNRMCHQASYYREYQDWSYLQQRHVYVAISFITIFHCAFYKLYVCFSSSILFAIAQRWYCLPYAKSLEPFNLFYYRQFAVVVYNTKIVFVINSKYVSINTFSQSSWYFMWHYCIFASCCLMTHPCGAPLDCFAYVSILVNPIKSIESQHCYLFHGHMNDV